MLIKKMIVSNFKSFDHLEVDLGRFNVLIGANASGKSNFVEVFKFLRDISQNGLDNAVSMQGGVEYLRNMTIGSSRDLLIKAVCDVDDETGREIDGRILWMKTHEIVYEFAQTFADGESDFRVSKDKAVLKCEFESERTRERHIGERKKLGNGVIELSVVDGKPKTDLEIPKEAEQGIDDFFPRFRSVRTVPPKTLILTQPIYFFPFEMLFRDASVYYFDPKQPKKAVPITGKRDLEEDGSNLAIVLKNIIENKEKLRKLSNLVRELLPFVHGMGVEKFADKSLLFNLKETYTKEQKLPASLVSDGTISMTALIVALYFERQGFVIVEEPERNVHPSLISRIVSMFKEASQEKQIVVTTHNAQMVKYAGIENLLLISRHENGFSTIHRPHEIEEVKAFLKSQIGIEDLFTENMLAK